jgi:hypothetical protein
MATKKDKIDAKALKAEFDGLDDEEKASVLKALGIEKDGDEDTATTMKQVLARLDKLEGKKARGFFQRIASDD